MDKHDPYQEAFILSRNFEYEKERRKPRIPRPLGSTPLLQHRHLDNMLCILQPQRFASLPLHTVVAQALQCFGKPKDWHLLVLEQPTTASDGVRVAYTRNEVKRLAHLNCGDPKNPHLTATTASKYLARHWPHIKSDKIRDLCEAHTFTFSFSKDLEEMVEIVIEARTYSCMKGFHRSIHPYKVYDPRYGWKLAYARADGEVVARALVNERYQCFVRTYGYENSQGVTQSHPGLHHFLIQEGYSYESEWPEGCEFAKIEEGGGYIAPYLDPGPDRGGHDCRRVTDEGDRFVRDDSGELEWDNTNGLTEANPQCPDCGDSCNEDDMVYIEGRDESICESCCNASYTYAYTGGGDREYVHDDYAIRVGGSMYDTRYTEEYDIVELYDGEYVHLDDAIYVERENEYYPSDSVAIREDDDGLIVYLKSRLEFMLRKECVWCLYNGDWVEEDDAIAISSSSVEGFVSTDNFDDYLLMLEREEISEVCISCDENVAEKLAMWDEHYAKNEAQLELG